MKFQQIEFELEKYPFAVIVHGDGALCIGDYEIKLSDLYDILKTHSAALAYVTVVENDAADTADRLLNLMTAVNVTRYPKKTRKYYMIMSGYGDYSIGVTDDESEDVLHENPGCKLVEISKDKFDSFEDGDMP